MWFRTAFALASLCAATFCFAAPSQVYRLSLEDLGHKQGLLFDAAEASQTIYFVVPRDTKITSGSLLLRYRSSPLLKEPSNLRVSLNDVPAKVIRLVTEDEREKLAEIAIEPASLEGPLLKVAFNIATRITLELCEVERMRSGFVQILPASELKLSTDGARPETVRAVTDTLPRTVSISLSSRPLSPDLYAAAWKAGTWLRQSGRRYRFTRLPEPGDIVIAPAGEIATLLPEAGHPSHSAQGAGNISVRYRSAGSYLAITEPFRFGMELLQPEWLNLARGAEYSSRLLPETGAAHPDRIMLRLAQLPVVAGPPQAAGHADWTINLGPAQLPPYYRVRKVSLELIAAPRLKGEPVMLHAYLNNTLLQSFRLPDSGERHRFTLDVPKKLAGRQQEFHFVAQRILTGGNCSSISGTLPVQLLPGTSFIAQFDREEPLTLADASDHLGNGFSLLLDPAHLSQPEESLPFLANLAVALQLPLDKVNVQIYAKGQAWKAGPFLFVGGQAPAGLLAPVRFDRGRVNVVDSSGRTLIDVDRLDGISVVQLAKLGSQHGIWIKPVAGALPQLAFPTALGDAVFLDASGLVRALNSRSSDVSQLRYPEFLDWEDLLRQYRYAVFGALWLAITVGFVQLYRKVIGKKETA